MEKLDWHGLKISPWENIIDGRMILDRIEEIESGQVTDTGDEIPGTEWPDDARTEHRVLGELVYEIGEQSCRNGVTLVRESYLTEHIRDEHLEIGPEFWEQDPDCRWEKLIRVSRDELYQRSPFNKIDWEAVAEEHRSDYSIVEFLGTTYYYVAE